MKYEMGMGAQDKRPYFLDVSTVCHDPKNRV